MKMLFEYKRRLELLPCISNGILPKAEKLLSNQIYSEAFFYAISSKTMRKYRSILDFTICHVFPEQHDNVLNYYKKKGSCLTELLNSEKVSVERVSEYDIGICEFLEGLLVKYKNKEV